MSTAIRRYNGCYAGGEDYDLEPESGEENRPSRHSRMHVNIRGKNYFKSESDNQTSNNQNKKDNENK